MRSSRAPSDEPATVLRMELSNFKCPHCGQMQGRAIGPNTTHIPAPAPPGWSVVVVSCLNATCLAPLGAYAYPSQDH